MVPVCLPPSFSLPLNSQWDQWISGSKRGGGVISPIKRHTSSRVCVAVSRAQELRTLRSHTGTAAGSPSEKSIRSPAILSGVCRPVGLVVVVVVVALVVGVCGNSGPEREQSVGQ